MKVVEDVVSAHPVSKIQLVRKVELNAEMQTKGAFLSIKEEQRKNEISELSMRESVGGRGKKELEGEMATEEDIEIKVEEFEEEYFVRGTKLYLAI